MAPPRKIVHASARVLDPAAPAQPLCSIVYDNAPLLTEDRMVVRCERCKAQLARAARAAKKKQQTL